MVWYFTLVNVCVLANLRNFFFSVSDLLLHRLLVRSGKYIAFYKGKILFMFVHIFILINIVFYVTIWIYSYYNLRKITV